MGQGVTNSVEASIQSELAVDAPPFIRPDQTLIRIADRVQRTFKIGLPEVEEPMQLREIGSQIVVLPDMGLQDGFEIGMR